MKKKLIHFSTVVILTTAVLFSFHLSTKAVQEPETKHVKLMLCCVGSSITGASSDCEEGAGECIDNVCGNSNAREIPAFSGSCDENPQ